MVTLRFVATERADGKRDGLIFYAFGDDAQTQFATEGDDGPGDARRALATLEPLDETAVDLEAIGGQA